MLCHAKPCAGSLETAARCSLSVNGECWQSNISSHNTILIVNTAITGFAAAAWHQGARTQASPQGPISNPPHIQRHNNSPSGSTLIKGTTCNQGKVHLILVITMPGCPAWMAGRTMCQMSARSKGFSNHSNLKTMAANDAPWLSRMSVVHAGAPTPGPFRKNTLPSSTQEQMLHTAHVVLQKHAR
jgi:hypothetical protein